MKWWNVDMVIVIIGHGTFLVTCSIFTFCFKCHTARMPHISLPALTLSVAQGSDFSDGDRSLALGCQIIGPWGLGPGVELGWKG